MILFKIAYFFHKTGNFLFVLNKLWRTNVKSSKKHQEMKENGCAFTVKM